MKRYIISLLLIFSTFLYAANGVVDENTVLDFEGITTSSVVEIGDYYKDKYGITFSAGSLAIVDSDDGGTGNFANEPKPGHTIAFFIDTSSLIMNVEKGFTHGFSFNYTTTDNNGSVVVYDGLNGTGKILKTIKLAALGSAGKGDPNGTFDTWKTIGVTFDGTAKSVSFAGVANQCGFDKISFAGRPPVAVFNFSLKLEDIGKATDARLSNTFMMKYENLKSFKDADGNNLENVDDVCKNYVFSVKDANNPDLGAKQTDCKFTSTALGFNKKVQLDFKINATDNTKDYFENGVLEICKKDDTTLCKELPVDGNFSVYGTNFDVKYHAYSFSNGSWNKANLTSRNNIAYAGEAIIDDYIKDGAREGLWSNIGYIKEKYYLKKFDKSVDSKGLCHGMAYTVVSNFNNTINSNETNIWGISGDIKSDWSQQIKEHENNLRTKPVPLNTYDIYDAYSKNSIEALKKIIYYFVTQEVYFNKKIKGNWIGGYQFDKNIENQEERNFLINLLKSGKVFGMRFSLKGGGGHAVVSTQLIKYGNTDKWYIYDNTAPGVYSYFLVKDSKSYKINNFWNNDNNTIRNSDGSIRWTVTNLGARFSNDPLDIYNSDITKKSVTRSLKRTIPTKETSDYNLYNHISLSLIGGKYLTVKEKSTNDVLPLLPIVDKLEKGKAYSDNANIFSNKLYLPNTSIYEVTVQKDASFPFLKLFAKVPNADGTIKIINYENIQSAEDSGTIARFYIGVNNTNTNIKRDDGPDYAPDFNQTLPLAITPVENLQASLLTTGVNFVWTNSKNPNLKETVIVRKEGSASVNPTDGTVLYTGLDTNYLDTTIDNNKLYYYTAFSISTTDEVSQATSVSIDTYKYSIYGKIIDANSVGIANVQVTLLNSDKSKTINIVSTDANGNYSFNNLTNGTYNVNYKNTFYQPINKEIKVEDKSFKDNETLVGLPYLAIEANNGFKIGNVEDIYWDGKNISGDQVNIKLLRNNTWETLFENVNFEDKSVQWRVTSPADENATLQISLASNSAILAEKTVNIGDGSVNYDLNYDGKIDIIDIMQVASKWNSKKNDGKYDTVFDLNNDGKIDIVDIMLIASKWGL